MRISPADILTIDGQIQKTIHILIPRWHLTTWVFASGDAAPLKGKRLPWTVKATGPGTFSVDEKTD